MGPDSRGAQERQKMCEGDRLAVRDALVKKEKRFRWIKVCNSGQGEMSDSSSRRE